MRLLSYAGRAPVWPLCGGVGAIWTVRGGDPRRRVGRSGLALSALGSVYRCICMMAHTLDTGMRMSSESKENNSYFEWF